MGRKRTLPSASMTIALSALVLAISGAAVALPGKNRVGADDIRKNAVRSKQIRGKSVKAGDVADNTLTSKQVKAEGLNPSDIAGIEISDQSLIRVTASESGLGLAAARAGAPETVLYAEGPLAVYAKCFRDSIGGEAEAGIFARTHAAGALLGGAAAGLPNDDANLLDPGTPETVRVIQSENVTAPDTADFGVGEAALAAPDGTSFRVLSTVGVKQGGVGAGGPFGSGNTCVFGTTVVG